MASPQEDLLIAGELNRFLSARGFDSSVISILEDNDVDMEVLATLTEDELRELGVKSFGIRRKLKLTIDKMNARCSMPPSNIPADLYKRSASELNSSISPESMLLLECDSESLCSASSPCKIQKRLQSSCSILVPTFDLKEALGRHPEGQSVSSHLDGGGILTSKRRKIFVRIAVANLVEICGLYPTTKQKIALAKAMVDTYPSTRDSTPGMEGHEHFYDNGHGFIEYRLKNIRISRPADEKRRPRRPVQPVQAIATSSTCPRSLEPDHLVGQDMEEKVAWMKYTPPTPENEALLRQFFIDTHEHRRSFLRREPTITEVIAQYPRFQDMPELINIEFETLFPCECDKLVTSWESYFRERIIAVGQQESEAVHQLITTFQDGDRDLCALHVLVYLLHRSVSRQKGQQSSASTRSNAVFHLIQNVSDGTDAESSIRCKDDQYAYPFLLSVGPATRPTEYYLALDRIAVAAGTHLIQAVDLLFKCHCVFNVRYSPTLLQFWEFFAAMVYGVMSPGQAKPHVRTFATAVRGVGLSRE